MPRHSLIITRQSRQQESDAIRRYESLIDENRARMNGLDGKQIVTGDVIASKSQDDDASPIESTQPGIYIPPGSFTRPISVRYIDYTQPIDDVPSINGVAVNADVTSDHDVSHIDNISQINHVSPTNGITDIDDAPPVIQPASHVIQIDEPDRQIIKSPTRTTTITIPSTDRTSEVHPTFQFSFPPFFSP